MYTFIAFKRHLTWPYYNEFWKIQLRAINTSNSQIVTDHMFMTIYEHVTWFSREILTFNNWNWIIFNMHIHSFQTTPYMTILRWILKNPIMVHWDQLINYRLTLTTWNWKNCIVLIRGFQMSLLSIQSDDV